MKNMYNLLIFLAFLNSGAMPALDSTSQKHDSLLNTRLNSQLSILQKMQSEGRDDSLKQVILEKQVANLNMADGLKRLALLKQLTALKQQDSLRTASQKQKIDSLRKFVKGSAVVAFHDTLFYIYTRQGSFTAAERASAISNRISKLSEDYSFRADSLLIIPSEQNTDILFKNSMVISVSENDALWKNTTPEKLAITFRNIIGKAIIQYQKEISWQTLIKEGLMALLVIILVIIFIYGINRLFKWLLKKAIKPGSVFGNGIKLNNYELLNASQQVNTVHFIMKVAKWVLIILLIYIALPILFGIFPFTRDISNTLLGYILNPLRNICRAVWNYIPNLITVLVIIIIFRYALRFLNYIKSEIAQGHLKIPGFYADWANPTYQITRILILAFMLIVIFPYMPGSDSPVFKGVSVFVGVLFTFGSAGALGNVVSGLVMTYMRAFKIGDRVKIGEVTGDITEKTLLVTRLRTIFNEVVSIPNSTVLSSHTINYSSEALEKGLIVHTTVTIGYDSPWRQVHQLLIDAAVNTALIEKEPVPYVQQTSLDDYYVSYRINAYTRSPNKQASIYSDLHANIQDYFNKAGVEIMSPHYKALRDGNAAAIPPEYLPGDYTPPAFNTKAGKD